MSRLRIFSVGLALGLLTAFMVGVSHLRQQAWLLPNARAMAGEEYVPKPDFPDAALLWRRQQLVDENGNIPHGALLTAVAQADQLRQNTALRNPTGGGLAPTAWQWLGPGNIGGRIRSLVIHPTQPSRMWAGSVGGGLWYTSNGGTAWAPVDDFMANLAITAIVFDPTNANIMYAGTGEGFTNLDAIRGAGVFKSTDGGVTWAQLSATNTSNFYYVNRLAIHPTNGQILLAGTRTGIFRSTNGGSNWTQVLPVGGNGIFDVDMHPTTGAMAVAGGNNGAWYSTDSGATWLTATLPSTAGRLEVAYAPSDPTIVYISANTSSGQVWKSTNSGQSYALVSTGNNYLGTQGWYDNALWVDPTNANTLIVGGIDLWRSINGGASLTRISLWQSAPLFSAHADQHVIVAHPQFDGVANRTVFFGNDGGVYRADNVYTVATTNGWQELNNNLGITQFYGAAGNPSAGTIIGGTQDNGTLRYTGNTENWNAVYGGDGGYMAADPTNANYFYGEYVYLNIHRTSNGGGTGSGDYISGQYWNGTMWAWKNAPYRIEDAFNSTANFIAPFVIDPNNPNRLLGGGLALWRTNDARTANTSTTGPSWANIKPAGAGACSSACISAIAIAPSNSEVVWVGHNNGDVYTTTNGTATTPIWVKVDGNATALPNRQATRIAISPADSNVVYVSFGGFNATNVWKTTNGGASWAAANGTGGTALPTAPVYGLAIHPTNTNWIYAATEVGIFVSEDGGNTWGGTNDGPANVSVMELFWFGNRLAAVTHGRGIYLSLPAYVISPTAGLNGSITPSTPQTVTHGSTLTFTITPNPGYSIADVRVDGASVGTPSVYAFTNITANHTITAAFALTTYTLTVNTAGTGSGVVTPTAGVYLYPAGTVVTLTAAPNVGSTFTGWSGACSGTGACSVTMTNTRSVTATFAINTYTLTVATAGTGTGVVTPAIGVYTYTHGSVVTLTAAANPGSTFTGWSGACSGTGACSVAMTNTRSVTANFTLNTYTLTITTAGTGSGVVTPTIGVYTYTYGAVVTLTASASADSIFAGWGGACSGTGSCVVTMNTHQSVSATFEMNVHKRYLPFVIK